MDLVVFENNKPWVIDEFREGHFDYVELASDVAETKFFQFLFGQQVVDRLVQHYPSPRDRHHVPLWMYVCSQLTLRLHGQHSFHSYPLIVRAGGLVDALGPEVARRQVDPESGNLTLKCAGFNDRNLYPRQTPCDQDFLRKLARDTEPESLEEWYNRHVVTVYKELGAFDADGLFIADGTYLFVPDNPRYEGSQRLLFDEHNHPVSKKQEQEMTKAQRARCRWRRCYTLRGHERNIFELLKVERHQRLQLLGVRGRNAVEDFLDGGLKVGELRMVAAVEGTTFGELPQAFDQVQVGRVRGEEQQRDTQLTGQCLDRGIVLIAGVVQHQRDRSGQGPNAAIFRNSSLIVSVLTTVVLVTAISWRVTAFHAPKTLNR